MSKSNYMVLNPTKMVLNPTKLVLNPTSQITSTASLGAKVDIQKEKCVKSNTKPAGHIV